MIGIPTHEDLAAIETRLKALEDIFISNDRAPEPPKLPSAFEQKPEKKWVFGKKADNGSCKNAECKHMKNGACKYPGKLDSCGNRVS